MKQKYTVGPESDVLLAPSEALLSAGGEEAGDASIDEAAERRESTVTAALHGSRLDKAVVAMAGEFSRNHLQTLIEAGHVWVDGALQMSASRKVLAGQRVAVELIPTQECRAFRSEAMSLAVVYEDDDVIVIDKPAGLVVHPAPGNWSGTLLNEIGRAHV